MLEIKKIKINGLNHKCNVTFDLQEDCTILIGENGVGKTSALKILQYLLSGAMSSVARYVFDSIVIIDSEEKFEFTQSDFVVPIEIIKTEFLNKCTSILVNNERALAEINFTEMISEIQKKELLGRFLEELCNFGEFSTVVNRIIEQYFTPADLFDMDLKMSLENPCYEDAPIYKSAYYKKIKKYEYWKTEVVFGDMVKKIKFPIKENSFVHFKFTRKGEGVKTSVPINENELREILENYDEYEVEMFFYTDNSKIETRQDFDFLNREFFHGTLSGMLHREKILNETFDIHSAIRAQYFSDYTICEINKIAVKGINAYFKYIEDVIEVSVDEVDELIKCVDKKVLFIHEQYICPILAEELPYKTNFGRLVRKIKWYMETQPKNIQKIANDIFLLRSYMEVYKELLNVALYIENVSDSVRSFQDLIAQYIDDKKICVTPKGISVYLNEDKEMTFVSRVSDSWMSNAPDSEERIVLGDVETEISLNSLSSGECKIIMLAYYATFFEFNILIMDEPELSISILWQQKLLRDLLDYGQFQSIIVATHSPYIARDESLADFLEYLP